MLVDVSPIYLGNDFDCKEQETESDSYTVTCHPENNDLWHWGHKNPMNMSLNFVQRYIMENDLLSQWSMEQTTVWNDCLENIVLKEK